MALAVVIYLLHLYREGAQCAVFAMSANGQIGIELGKGVATIKVLGIPLLGFLEGIGFAFFGFIHRHLHQCQLLGVDWLAPICPVDVMQKNLH